MRDGGFTKPWRVVNLMRFKTSLEVRTSLEIRITLIAEYSWNPTLILVASMASQFGVYFPRRHHFSSHRRKDAAVGRRWPQSRFNTRIEGTICSHKKSLGVPMVLLRTPKSMSAVTCANMPLPSHAQSSPFSLSLSLMIIHPVGSYGRSGRTLWLHFFLPKWRLYHATIIHRGNCNCWGGLWAIHYHWRHNLSCGRTSASPGLAAPSCAWRHLQPFFNQSIQVPTQTKEKTKPKLNNNVTTRFSLRFWPFIQTICERTVTTSYIRTCHTANARTEIQLLKDKNCISKQIWRN